MAEPIILFVDHSSSTCCFCLRGADPEAITHDKVIDYGIKNEVGCGRKFTHLATSRGKDTADRWIKKRPDLKYIGVGEVYERFVLHQSARDIGKE